MKKKSINLFISYIKNQRKSLFLFFLWILCFSTVFSLSNLPLEPILYASLLFLYIGIIYWVIDFYFYMKRFRTLIKLQRTITIKIDDLPSPTNTIEQQYEELIRILHQEKNRLSLQADSKLTDLMDYFTQWTHQIKTPIAAMRLLLQSKSNEQNIELEMELFKIEQYVEFVLQYLRLDHMSSDFVLKQYDLNEIVKQAIRKQAKMFIRKKISLHFTEIQCQVLTDEKWLLFVIDQLLSNAIKYTQKGSISIYMEQGDRKILVIEDTGIGISEEDLPRVFEKGFTGYNGRVFNTSTGIGLYLCKKILTKLSHQISIESEVGRGTKVRVDLTTEQIEVE